MAEMTQSQEQPKKKPRGKAFASGYDPRRNIKGRHVKGETLAERVRDKLAEPVNKDNPNYTTEDAILDVLKEKALDGDMDAIVYLHARGYGKIPDRLQIGVQQKTDLSRLTAEEYEQYKRLFIKATQDDDIVDANLLTD